MLGINGKQWNDIQWTDVEEFLNEIEESFFFEFKKDEVSGAKLIKEIAALANTYGGYVFLGVSDDKKIEGCQKWDEQRIHATIHIHGLAMFRVKMKYLTKWKNKE